MIHLSSIAVLAVLLCGSMSLGCVRTDRPRVQGSGVAASEDRTAENFDNVTVEGSADVNIAVGPETQVTVHADDNVLPLIETKVKGDTLVISSTGLYSTKLGVKVIISVPQLNGIAIKGAGDVDVKGVDSENFAATVAGSGDVKVAGKTQKLNVSVRGSGDLKLQDLEATRADVSIAGSGDVTVNVVEELSVSIAGSGDVKYKGTPKVSKSIAGSGSVRQVG